MYRYRISEIGQKVTAAGFRPLDVLLVGATGHQPYPGLSEKDAYAAIIGYRSFKIARPYAV